jgi:hypothetical protein
MDALDFFSNAVHESMKMSWNKDSLNISLRHNHASARQFCFFCINPCRPGLMFYRMLFK